MGKRKEPLYVGEMYHVYNRGVDKRVIFKNQREFNKFADYLQAFNTDQQVENYTRDLKRDHEGGPASVKSSPLVEIISYCLLANHFHLIVKPLVENGVSKFMQKVCTGYTMYFNTKHDRTGALFQGRFKAKHVSSEEYFVILSAYVTCNYQVHGIDKESVKSAIDYIFDIPEQYGLSKDISSYFKTRKSFEKLCKDKNGETIRRRLIDREMNQILIEGGPASVFIERGV